MQNERAKTYSRWQAAGYYSFDETAGSYTPTFKGAYLMTWKVLPPFKQLQQIKSWLRTDRIIRELGFGGIRSFYRSGFDQDGESGH